MQVPPAELEHILQSIPDIADAAVIPYVHVFLFSAEFIRLSLNMHCIFYTD